MAAQPDQAKRWGTIGFMIAIHALSIVALLPQFWSWQAVSALTILYWVTACLGVTIGYHRLLSHRSFRVPTWLERFFATCGALSCQHGPIDWVGLHRHHHKFSDTDADHTTAIAASGGATWAGCSSRSSHAGCACLSGDLVSDPYYRWLNTYFLLLQLPLGLLLFWIGSATGVGGWAMVPGASPCAWCSSITSPGW